MAHKFYLVKFENKKYKKPNDGKVLVKPGNTYHMNIMNRFDKSFDDGYKKDYDDWKITPIFSKRFETKQEAIEFENYFLYDKLPYNSEYKVWVEDYLGIEDRQKYNDTGITELRLISQEKLKEIREFLYNSLSVKDIREKAKARRKYSDKK